jgi:thiol-disulfide isomerase/thioredoxin
MNSKFSAVTSASLFFFLILLSGCTEISNDNESPITNDGHNFSFSLLDGTTKQLIDYRGKVVIMDLWATWCSPCQVQMLELRKAYTNYSRDELEILSINIDERETASTIQNFLDQYKYYGYELKWIFAEELDNLDEYNPLGSIPRLCIFDKYGTLFWEHNGLTYYNRFPEGWTYEKIPLKEKIDQALLTQ